MKSIIEDDHSINDIVLTSEQGIVTWLDIENAIEDYKSRLPVPENLYTKIQTFDGMIRYVYTTVINKVVLRSNRIDYSLLNDVFYKIYLPLCNIYGFIPSIALFSNMIGVSHSTLSNANNSNSVYKTNVVNGNSDVYNFNEYDRYSKAWTATCEAALSGQVANHNSIGSMFLLKAKYGYSENNTLTVQTADNVPKIDEKQLVGIASGSLPELPDNMP